MKTKYCVILFIGIMLSGCKSSIQYVPIEKVRIEKVIETVHDTIIQVKLVPYYTQNTTSSNKSFLENQYAFSNAFWDGNFLHHDLGIKDIDIPVEIQYVNVETVRIDSIPYPVEVQIKGDTIYKMKWYEEIVFYIGLVVMLLGGVYGIFRLIKRKFF